MTDKLVQRYQATTVDSNGIPLGPLEMTLEDDSFGDDVVILFENTYNSNLAIIVYYDKNDGPTKTNVMVITKLQ